MRLQTVGVLVLLCLLATCARPQEPSIYPRPLYSGERIQRDFWLSAPLIAVVKVHKIEQLQRKITIEPKVYEFRLTRVSAQVENVLAGKFAGDAVVFYFFANELTEGGYHTVRYWLQPGERWIVFLREEGGVLRTMSDLEELRMPVNGGIHTQLEIPHSDSVAERIAYILLTPGRGYNTRFFNAALPGNLKRMLGIGGLKYTVMVLRDLLSHPDKNIRVSACLTLAEALPGQDRCLGELSDDSEDTIRTRASELLRKHAAEAHAIADELKNHPLMGRFSGQIDDLPDEMELYTTHRNKEVRELACKILTNCFPTHHSSNCAERR